MLRTALRALALHATLCSDASGLLVVVGSQAEDGPPSDRQEQRCDRQSALRLRPQQALRTGHRRRAPGAAALGRTLKRGSS